MAPDLLKRIQLHHDEQAFKSLYEQYAFDLFQLAYAYLKNRELAEEAVNDVFLSVWKKKENLPEIENIYLYLCKSVKNSAIDYLESGKKRAANAMEAQALQTDHIGFVMDPEHLMINRELNQQIKKAILSLPPRCRLIFKLIKEDGLKYREVAELLSLSSRTVETQLAIALKRIGSSLLPHLPESRILQKVKKEE